MGLWQSQHQQPPQHQQPLPRRLSRQERRQEERDAAKAVRAAGLPVQLPSAPPSLRHIVDGQQVPETVVSPSVTYGSLATFERTLRLKLFLAYMAQGNIEPREVLPRLNLGPNDKRLFRSDLEFFLEDTKEGHKKRPDQQELAKIQWMQRYLKRAK